MAQKRTLVILGGGFGGLPLARKIEQDKKLSQLLNVILIDKKEYYEMNLASVRFLVAPEEHGAYTRPYSELLTSTRFIHGAVRAVQSQPQQVEIVRESESGNAVEFIPYDYLVISLGTRYPLFKAEAPQLAERVGEVARMAQQIRNANNILIIGGRSVGLEILGEILHVYKKEKQITIVHTGNSLMDVWPKSGVKKTDAYIKKRENVKVVLGKKFVRSVDDTHHELSDGSIVEADLKIFSTGAVPNSESLQQYFASSLTQSGFVKVRKTLQLESHDNIFAIGDIADNNQAKMAANIKGQIALILKNLSSLINNKSQATLGNQLMAFPGLVTLGPEYGILALPLFGGSSFSGKMLSTMKTGIFEKAIKNPGA